VSPTSRQLSQNVRQWRSLGKDLYQGIASAMPPNRSVLKGFSRWGFPAAAQRLKPAYFIAVGGTPEGMP
jgi:hypothetical protein